MSRRKKRPSAHSKPRNRNATIALLVVIAITAITFLPTLDNDFVDWDDDVYILENPSLQDLTLENVISMFTRPGLGNYIPLTNITYALENEIFGMEDAFIYHLDNLLLHLLCVLLVFTIGRKLGLTPLAASAFALLFGIHPIRVESVAWVTERKDVLYGAFYLGSMYAYIRFLKGKRKKKRWWYWVVALFVLSLFSKIQAVSLPLALLAIDYLLRRPLRWKLVLEKWLLFALSLTVGILGILILSRSGTIEVAHNVEIGFAGRLCAAAYAYLIYIGKFIFPWELYPAYVYPNSLTVLHYLSVPVVGGLMYLLYLGWKKKKRALVFGFAFYTFNIIFLLQVLGAGQGYLADRYAYISYIGLAFPLAWHLQRILKKKPSYSKIAIGIISAYLLILSVLSWRQSDIWQNTESLWAHALKSNSLRKSSMPWGLRGRYYRKVGKKDLALSDMNEAIRLNPTYPLYYNVRAGTYYDRGQNLEALKDFDKAIELEPDNAEYLTNRAITHMGLNQRDQALTDLNSALSLDTDFASAYRARLLLYYQAGLYVESLQDHDSYLALEPNDPDVWYSRGLTNRVLGNAGEAISDFTKAIRLRPTNPAYYLERAKVHIDLGNPAGAEKDRQQAARLQAGQ